MAINAGNLRYKIVIQESVNTKDSYGSEKQTWMDYMVLRASVKYLNGTKGVDSSEIFTSYGVEFTTYYRGAINSKMQIIFNDKKFRINNISEIGFREGLLISTELINE